MSPTAISPFSKAIAGVLFSLSKPPTDRTTTFNSSFESLPIRIYESSLFTWLKYVSIEEFVNATGIFSSISLEYFKGILSYFGSLGEINEFNLICDLISFPYSPLKITSLSESWSKSAIAWSPLIALKYPINVGINLSSPSTLK